MTFIYGDRDWMDPRGGQRALAGARRHLQPTTPGDLRLFTVKESGHYTFLDQVLHGSSVHLLICSSRTRRVCMQQWVCN